MTDNTSHDFAGLVNLKGIPLSDSSAGVSYTARHPSRIGVPLSDRERGMSDSRTPVVGTSSGREMGA